MFGGGIQDQALFTLEHYCCVFQKSMIMYCLCFDVISWILLETGNLDEVQCVRELYGLKLLCYKVSWVCSIFISIFSDHCIVTDCKGVHVNA